MRNAPVAALDWICRRLNDPVGGGFLWVRRAGEGGIVNQVWEDSSDSYHHEDGTLFDPSRPFVPVAVQGYAYDALIGAAELLERGPTGIPTTAPANVRSSGGARPARGTASWPTSGCRRSGGSPGR